MADLFDPSAFLAAEESQTLAKNSGSAFAFDTPSKTAEIRDFSVPPDATLAELATLAAPVREYPWAAGLAELEAMPCPPGVDDEAWYELVNEAAMVSKYWGAAAMDCGWSELDLFGCNPNPLARRLDRDGLVVGIAGFAVPLKITAIDESAATLVTMRGDVLRHYRRKKEGQVLLWEAYRMPSGP